MISLEQVQLLESRVARAIEYVQKVNAENAALVSEKSALQVKIDAYQKRIEELEVFVLRFKDEQGRIEDGIIAALDRLSQFEEAVESSLKEKSTGKKSPAKPKEKSAASGGGHNMKAAAPEPESKEVFFEITENEAGKDDDSSDDVVEGELDIF